MRYLFTALGVLFLLAAIYMATAYFCFRKAARRGREANIDKFLAAKQFDGYREELSAAIAYVRLLPYEDVYITSGDGLRLHAKVFRAENERASVLLFHGYRSDYGYFDFGAVIRKYLEKGISLLLVDQRSHGKSEGKYIGFGIKERGDCLLWAAEATRIFAGLPLVLEGLSMGATTVLMASGDDLPPEVKGIIADCGFTSPKAILSEVIRADYHLPPRLILPAMNLWFRMLAHYDIREYSTTVALAKCRLPVLFIHGTGDDFVPYRMGEENAAAFRGDGTFISVSGAGHGMSYLVNREKCEKALDAFLAKTLGV